MRVHHTLPLWHTDNVWNAQRLFRRMTRFLMDLSIGSLSAKRDPLLRLHPVLRSLGQLLL